MKALRLLRWPLILLLVTATPALAHVDPQTPDFFYAGGTGTFTTGCGGDLELTHVSMTFRCPQGSVTIPYSSITLMQYRPKLSSQVRKLKLHWTVKPYGTSAKRNQLFTILYKEGNATQALVLRVQPQTMRPYLAEIELNTRKRIEVWDYRGYD